MKLAWFWLAMVIRWFLFLLFWFSQWQLFWESGWSGDIGSLSMQTKSQDWEKKEERVCLLNWKSFVSFSKWGFLSHLHISSQNQITRRPKGIIINNFHTSSKHSWKISFKFFSLVNDLYTLQSTQFLSLNISQTYNLKQSPFLYWNNGNRSFFLLTLKISPWNIEAYN